jgi:hypothetical protein
MNEIKLIEFKNIETNTKYKYEFYETLNNWTQYAEFNLHPNFFENVMDIRSGMQPRITLQPIDMLDYKKNLIAELKDEYDALKEDGLNFTDAELTANRILEGKNRNQKITKYMTNIIAKSYPHRLEQRIDYFNKPKHEKNEYYIDKDPIQLMQAYLKVDTCVSPQGSNQSNMLKFLFSPYVYVAYDKKRSVRILIYADFSRRVVFLNGLYGSYDAMMPMVVIKYFVERGFTFGHYTSDIFDDDFLTYKDRTMCAFEPIIERYNGHITSNLQNPRVYGVKDLFERPSWVNYEGDGMILSKHTSRVTTSYNVRGDDSYIGERERYYCDHCDNNVDEDDFNHDEGVCNDCYSENHRYCDRCGDDAHVDDYNFEEEACSSCANEIIEEREEKLREDREEKERDEEEAKHIEQVWKECEANS